MSTYSGNDLYSESFTKPDDGNTINALNVNTPTEALGDRTAWLVNRLRMQAAHFDPPRAEVAHVATKYSGRAAFNARKRQWFVGFTDGVHATHTTGAWWRAPWYGNNVGIHLAFINDAGAARYGNGIGVEVNGSIARWDYTYGPPEVGVMGAVIGAAITSWASVMWDKNTDKWVIFGYNGAAPEVRNAPTPTGSAFTVRALPAGATFANSACNDGSGNILVIHKALGIAKSVDGGDNWAEIAGLPFVGSLITTLGFDRYRQRFICAVSDLVAKTFEVWVSTDQGTTWTSLGVQPVAFLSEIVNVGPTLVGTFSNFVAGEATGVLVSVDGGIKWSYGGGIAWPDATLGRGYLASNDSDVVAVNLGTNTDQFSFARGFAPVPLT